MTIEQIKKELERIKKEELKSFEILKTKRRCKNVSN